MPSSCTRWARRSRRCRDLELPTGGAARLNGEDGGRRPGPEAVDEPRRRTSRGCAELGCQRQTGFVDAGGPALLGPASGHGGNRGAVRHLAGLAVHRQVELAGGSAQRTARIAGQVLPLARPGAGLEPECTLDPERADAGDVRAPVRVDGGEPRGVAVRAAGLRGLAYSLTEPRLDAVPLDQGGFIQVGEVGGAHGSVTSRPRTSHRSVPMNLISASPDAPRHRWPARAEPGRCRSGREWRPARRRRPRAGARLRWWSTRRST